MAEPPTEEERVNLVGPAGERVNVPISEAQLALGAGFRVATPEDEAAEAEKQFRQTAPEQVKTAAEGAFRGLTLGLGEPVLAGISSAEDVAARKAASPELALGAEAVGAIAPLFASGGTGALAAGARAAGAAPRALAGVGAAVERGAAGLLGKGIAGRAAATAAGGAVEGAVVGAGQAVSEAVLTDTELTGEMVAAGMGHGALLGGAAGGVLGAGVGIGAKALEKGAGAVRGVLPEGALGKVGRQADDGVTIGEAAAKGMDDAAARKTVAGAADDVADTGKESMLDQFRRRQRAHSELQGVQNKSALGIADRGTELELLGKQVERHGGRNVKLDAVSKALKKEVPAERIGEVAEQSLALVRNTRREMQELTSNKTSRLLEGGDAFKVNKMRTAVDEAEVGISKAVKDGDLGKVYQQMDVLKARLGTLQGKLKGGGTVATPGQAAIELTPGAIMRREYDSFRTHLEDTGLWGQGAVDIQKPLNAKWVANLKDRNAFERRFLRDEGGEHIDDFGWDQARIFGSDAAETLVKRSGGDAGGRDALATYRTQLQSRSDLIEEMGRNFDLSDAVQAKVARHKKLTDEALSALDDAERTTIAAREHKAWLDDWADVPFASTATKLASTLAEKAHKLAGMQSKAVSVSGKLDQAVKAAVSGTKKAARKAKTVARAGAARAPRAERFKDAAERVNKGAQNPVAMGEQVVRQMGDHAVTSAVVGTVVRGNAFLKSKMPAPMVRESERQPHIESTQRVSNSEMSKWLRYVEAVEDPMSTVQALEDGTLRREGAEALRVVHPKIYIELKKRVTEQVADETERIPRGRLTQLSILFDEPYHFSMEPEFLQSMQQNAAAAEEESNQGGGFIAPSSRKPPDTSGDHMTETQRISQ